MSFLRAAYEHWWARSIAGTILVSVPLVLIVLVVGATGSATDQRIVMTFLVYLVVAVGLQTFVGTTGVISFAHVALMGVGAYTAALLTTPPMMKERLIPDAPLVLREAELGFATATLIACAVTMVVALLAGFALVRLSGAAAAVGTLGLLVILNTVLSNAESITRGALAFTGIPRHSNFGWALSFAILSVFLSRLLRDSHIGLALRSSREDVLAAGAAGVNVSRARLFAWVASAGLAGLGGSLYGHYLLTLLPSTFYFALTFLIVTMVIIGGQTVSGVVLGAGFITLVTEFLRRAEHGFSLGPFALDQAPGLTTIALGLMIVGVLTLRPQGLLGRWELDESVMRFLATRDDAQPSRGHDPPGGSAKDQNERSLPFSNGRKDSSQR